jgi:uncharacterized membrane protein YhaH (DUF805 family)
MPVGVIIVAVIAAVVLGMSGGFGGASAAIGIGAISFIVLLVFFCQDGTQGPNRFGDDPKNPVTYEGVFD